MARPRQPIELIEIKGKKHLTKTEKEQRKKTEIKGSCAGISAPEYLSTEQKQKFYRIADELVGLNIMCNLDCDALARYLIAEDAYLSVTQILAETDIGDVGILGYSKLVTIQDKYFKQCRGLASDMGLTISGRCRLVVPKAEEHPKENKFAKFGGMSG